MFARRALIFGITVVGAVVLTASTLYPMGESRATSQVGIKVSDIGATPSLVAPVDVLTIKTTVSNDVATMNDVAIKLTVRDEMGQSVLEEQQTGIDVAQDGKRTVYWTWRIPDRLSDGQYAVDMAVVGDGEKVLATDIKDAAFRVERSEQAIARSTR